MVQLQLRGLEQLMASGFGRPFPRHGLQLLFWFANNCVTCEPVNFVLIMRTMYFEVGNLNTETYPGSADLPAYVRENYGSDANGGISNTDRIIIGYQVRARLVDTVYVTEHDGTGSGRFSFERTHQISSELIRALQSPLLDVTTFLTQMGYYAQMWECQSYNTEHVNYPEPSAQQTFLQWMQCTAATSPSYDSSGAFQQQLDASVSALSYDQRTRYAGQDNRGLLAAYKEMEDTFRTARYPPCGWYDPLEGFDGKPKKRRGGFSLVKLLLGAGALYLAVRCFSWLRSCWGSSARPQRTHVLLDYVY